MIVHVASSSVEPSIWVATGMLVLAIPDRETSKTRIVTTTSPTSVMRTEEEVERVRVGRDGRRLARKEREGVEPFHRKIATGLD